MAQVTLHVQEILSVYVSNLPKDISEEELGECACVCCLCEKLSYLLTFVV